MPVRANVCIYYEGCRYQQSVVMLQKEYKISIDACWANQVHCDDEKTDMEKRCSLFKPSPGAAS